MRTRPRGQRHRYRGQMDASSWAARTPAPLGALVAVALFLLSCLVPSVAGAAQPSPQKAPASATTHTPDPAPQASTRTHVSHSSPPPVTTRSTTPVVVVPRVVHTTAPAQSTSTVPSASVASGKPASAPTPAPRHPAHPASRHVAPARHAPPPQPAAHPISLSFLFGLLPSDLLRLPHAAGGVSHPGGVLLLLSSVAMGVLAVASFALLRRLRRLEGQHQ